MDYPYEKLDPERFQHLCQALLTREFAGLQSLPVAQPDGGRDAYQVMVTEGRKGLLVFQVKFARDPSSISDARKWLIDITKQEAIKVSKLLPQGVERYVLITNVPGTAHPRTGSIDTLQRVLDSAFAIPASAWWRDDLNRKLDNAYDVRWAYWELLQAPDLLRALLESGLGEARERRLNAIQAFVAKQHEQDEQVRFKQIELENDLLDLFVDVPAGLKRGPGDRRARHVDDSVLWSIASASSSGHQSETAYNDEDEAEIVFSEEPAVGAAALFLSSAGQGRFPNVVLDGAPGQGKSTLAQYICQVHRLLLLRKHGDLKAIPDHHRPSAARLPIKVDLREFAVWVGGIDPFSEESEEKRPAGTTRSLESFLAGLISFQSGGSSFEVSDLQAVVGTSAVLLVLDGLDEVADIGRREEVAREINSGVKRLAHTAASLQVIVTTRPSALADISGFSPRLYYHFTLLPLTKALIDDYAARWTLAKHLEGRQGARLRRIFTHRLSQPHLGDLARNPMQLAILLSVINAREDSFPDKRTALYDMYVEIFLARESAKSEVVRTHRELLIDVHMYLAWVLHAGAETGQELGRIDQETLERELRSYLSREGRDAELAKELFGGVTQRVVFLVQRIEGTYEFEVQPLREYFAGRYLYETAPYSPPGRERKGTKPDRFDGLARSPYWLNVTRFFTGCFSKGEQPALAERLETLAEDPEYKLTSYPRVLAAILVGDWVFAQSQRSLRAVVRLMTNGAAFRQLLYGRNPRSNYGVSLALPSGSGREELLDRCFEVITSASDGDTVMHACHMARENGSRSELLERWLELYSGAKTAEDQFRLLYAALWLGVLSRLVPSQFHEVLGNGGLLGTDVVELLLNVRPLVGFLESGGERAELVVNRLLDDGSSFIGADVTGLRGLAGALNVVGYYPIFMGLDERMTLKLARVRNFPHRSPLPENTRKCEAIAKVNVALRTVEGLYEESLGTWRTSLRPWNEMVEGIREVYGEKWALHKLAVLASTVSARLDSPEDGISLFDARLDLCVRARLARLRAGNFAWWKRQLTEIETPSQEAFAVLLALHAAGPATLVALSGDIDSLVNRWSADQYERVLSGMREVGNVTRWVSRRQRSVLSVRDLPAELSARTITLLGRRGGPGTKADLYQRYLSSYAGNQKDILELCQEVLLEAVKRDPNVWFKLLDVVERAHNDRQFAGSALSIYLGWDESWVRNIPIEAARIIAQSDAKYPLDLVVLAQRKCQQVLSEGVEALAVVAGREGWFEEGFE